MDEYLKETLAKEMNAMKLEKKNEGERSNSTIKLLSAESQKLKLALEKTMAELKEKRAHEGKIISDLTRENRLLVAQVNQLQSSIVQSVPTKNVASVKPDKVKIENDYFEVEKLIDDKIEKNVRYYLVRWKRYSSCDDSWVRECDLKCQSILKKYKASKHQRKQHYTIVVIKEFAFYSACNMN